MEISGRAAAHYRDHPPIYATARNRGNPRKSRFADPFFCRPVKKQNRLRSAQAVCLQHVIAGKKHVPTLRRGFFVPQARNIYFIVIIKMCAIGMLCYHRFSQPARSLFCCSSSASSAAESDVAEPCARCVTRLRVIRGRPENVVSAGRRTAKTTAVVLAPPIGSGFA